MELENLLDMDTPKLVLSIDKVDRNVARMKSALSQRGVGYRPHLKTAKSVDVTQRIIGPLQGPVTVSTLKEVEVFAAAGFKDILYAVGISPQKLSKISAFCKSGVNLAVLLDSQEQALAVAKQSREAGVAIPVFIEVDCDGHRSGVKPDDKHTLLAIAGAISNGAELRGVLTHAGLSYNSRDIASIQMWAERERNSAVIAAEILREAGYVVPIVSVGSTPTALYASDHSGVTEVRAGVFMFFDLVQMGVGICTQADIALSVLATVIGHQKEEGRLIVDAGWMALSRDRGTATQVIDQKYGMVCDVDGNPYADLLVLEVNQEHGVVGIREGSDALCPDLPIGTKVRILPNHACATAAQHDGYVVVTEGSTSSSAYWPRFNGW